MNSVIEIDAGKKTARVEPGTILDDLRNQAERHHLTFGPDPATHTRCTLGGMIGNNSCGVHSIIGGMTSDNIEELEILTYDGLRMRVGKTSEQELDRIIREGGRRGEIYSNLKSLRDRYGKLIRKRFPDIPRRASGYNLVELLPENEFHVARALVGSEGTCVTVLEATTRLIYSPPARVLLVLGYKDVYAAGDHIMEVKDSGPVGLEGMDDRLVYYMQKQGLHPDDVAMLPDGGGWLLVEFGGESAEDASAQARRLMEKLKKKAVPPTMRLFEDPEDQERIWVIRESGLGATARVPNEYDTWPGWEDSSVPPEKLGSYLRDLRRLLDRYDYDCSLYGHFGQACVHVRIDFDLKTREGISKYRSFVNDAADLVVRYGGSFSGEHGDGQARAELLPKMFGSELVEAFRQFKSIWDPEWKMNPGKVVDPYRMDEELRLGTSYDPWSPKTNFSFPEDNGSFPRAALRCVGVGECRRMGASTAESNTMCPSFMVTREEKHSTRGRARLLFEMMEGEVIPARWRNEAVKEALDLCLACKGCKGDCPVHVDMATYKAEFLSHYYAGRIRPITAYSMGLIYWWSRLAALMPKVANFFTQTPLLSNLVKLAGGVSSERKIPAFAPQTFTQWFNRRQRDHERRDYGDKPRVVLWPDTFNNHFYPETARAAFEVLEAAGFQVEVPPRSLCCGRPLYDYGMLGTAKRLLVEILRALKPQIEWGVPVVVLEPSCAAVFRDELINLLPNDEDAARLSGQTFLLGEFLEKNGDRFDWPTLQGKAVVHGHCHHKAIMKMADEEAMLKRLGLDYEVLASGCCGMAGSFGFERGEHYDVSVSCGERVLLPAVRRAAKETIIIADGFSCREQIAQLTDRHAFHLAQVIKMAADRGANKAPDDYPEAIWVRKKQADRKSGLKKVAVIGAVAAVIGGLLVWRLRKLL
jgi:FAD/FMN-containing dehydrogenase/Fe-S oxidoreductase